MEVKLTYDYKKAKTELRRMLRLCIIMSFFVIISLAISVLLGFAISWVVGMVFSLIAGLIIFFFGVIRPELIDPDSLYITDVNIEYCGRFFSASILTGKIYRFEKEGGTFIGKGMIQDGEYVEKGIITPNFIVAEIKIAEYIGLDPVFPHNIKRYAFDVSDLCLLVPAKNNELKQD